MKRVLAVILTLVGCGALAFLATGASDDREGGTRYWVEFDDAFGIIEGGDLKIGGVRAGKTGTLKLDEKTHRALVEIIIEKEGFGSIRTDVTCQARPQSLIGEYFVDCDPGTDAAELEPGSVIPVEKTSSVVSVDLVNNILRRPYRERLSIIINQLGAAVAGNGENLNEAIKRASPALAETDKVLKILADQNEILADLVRDGDKVIGDLAENKGDVARWVEMANRTSTASAERAADISRGWARLPEFLEELGPAMEQLGNVADEQTPALRTLSESAGDLKTFFDRLAPFSEVSEPAIQALGEASEQGRAAVQAAGGTVAELRRFAKGTPELANNLDIILDHLNDRDNAVEDDADSPDGTGFTGLEALLQYVFDQGNSINVYDSSVHILKVAPFVSACENYADTTRAIEAEEGKLIEECRAAMGPYSAGVNFPDTTRRPGLAPFGPLTDAEQDPFPDEATATRARKSASDSLLGGDTPVTTAPALPPATGDAPAPREVPTLGDVIPGAPDVVIPAPPVPLQEATKAFREQRTQAALLDYLLGT